MSEYDTVYTILQCDFGLFNEGKLKKGIGFELNQRTAPEPN